MWNSVTQNSTIDVKMLDRLTDVCTKVGNDKNSSDALLQYINRIDVPSFFIPVLESDISPKSIFYTLKAMKNYVTKYWSIDLPQRDEIKDFLLHYSCKLVEINKHENITMCNQVIVAIASHEWPQYWVNFMDNILEMSKSSQSQCMNALSIITILATDINEFATESGIKSARAGEMNAAFSENINNILETIVPIILNPSSNDKAVVKQALEAFYSICPRIDSSEIFKSDIIPQIITLYMTTNFSSEVIRILAHIVTQSFIPEEYYQLIPQIFDVIIDSLSEIITETFDFSHIPDHLSCLLSHTMPSFIEQYSEAIENEQHGFKECQLLHWIILLTRSSIDDTFEKCIDFWHSSVQRICNEMRSRNSIIYSIYEPVLSDLRQLLIEKVVVPVEVIKNDEDDELLLKSNVSFGNLYQNMKETLVLLTHIDSRAMIKILSEIMKVIEESQVFEEALFLSLCYAGGAIINALSEQVDKQFVFCLLEFVFGISSNAVDDEMKTSMVSGVTFFVSQLSKYLIRDDELLTNLLQSLFVFLSDGTDISKILTIYTFQQIANQCRSQLTNNQKSQSTALVEGICQEFGSYFAVLPPTANHILIEVLGKLIRMFSDENSRIICSESIFSTIDSNLQELIGPISPSEVSMMKLLINSLRNQTAAASSMSTLFFTHFAPYIPQIINLYVDTLRVTNTLVRASQSNMSNMLSSIEYRTLLSLQGELLILMSAFTSGGGSFPDIESIVIKPLIETLFPMYHESFVQSRSPKFFHLLSQIVSKCGNSFLPYVDALMTYVYQPTIDMIREEFDSYYYLRNPFYSFLHVLIRHASGILKHDNYNLIIELIGAIKWGTMHPQHEISVLGIQILQEVLRVSMFKNNEEFAAEFFSSLGVELFVFVFEILTDTKHKFAFSEQVNLIKELLQIPQIYEKREEILESIIELFPNVPPQSVSGFLIELFQKRESSKDIREMLEDFLITVRHILKTDPDLLAEQKKEALLKIREQIKELEGIEEHNEENE